MKVRAISDIHGYLKDNNSYCDVLIVAGDIVPLSCQLNEEKSLDWFRNDFLKWCADYPCKKVIFIGGNHDFFLDKYKATLNVRKEIADAYLNSKVVYLNNDGYEYEGKWFWGCPNIVGLPSWAFNDESCEHYQSIPDCDVLITHQPISGEVGTVSEGRYLGRDFGSKELLESLKGRKIKAHVCGHVHSGKHGGYDVDGTTVYNVSIRNEEYKVAYEDTEFEI